MSLTELINQEKLKTIQGVSLEQIRKRFSLAYKFFQLAKKFFPENQEEYNEVIYTNLYNAARILSEAYLLFNGYKAAAGLEHHKIVIQAVKLLMNDKQMEAIFSRLDRMRKQRNVIDYDVLTPFVSKQIIEQSIEDIQKYLDKVEHYLEKANPQKRLIK
jgi:hypothetical protein